MKPSPESSSSNESTESISTEWDNLVEPDNIEQNTNIPELKENIINKEQNAEFAPEGWFTIRGLARELGLGKPTIQRYVNQDPPIEGKEYKIKNGNLVMHYPLSEVAKRVEYLTSAELAPEGYYTIYGLATELKVTYSTIQKAILKDPPIEGK